MGDRVKGIVIILTSILLFTGSTLLILIGDEKVSMLVIKAVTIVFLALVLGILALAGYVLYRLPRDVHEDPDGAIR